MKYCEIKMMALTCLLLLCGLTLSAQEGIAKTIFIDFVNLDAFSSYEELNDFQMDRARSNSAFDMDTLGRKFQISQKNLTVSRAIEYVFSQ